MNDGSIKTEATTEAVKRVIGYMYENLGNEVTIDDMARTAMFSKFHFSRIFHEATGISPGRFLSAIRLQAAKRLLVSTSLTVTDICFNVGYNSVGTFSSRFTSVVGTPPTAYRENGGFVSQIHINRRGNSLAAAPGVIRGNVFTPPDRKSDAIFVGIFPDPIIQSPPIRYKVLHQAGPYVLEDVPQGTWYALGHSFSVNDDRAIPDPVNDDRPPSIAVHGPITVGARTIIGPIDMKLRPMRIMDPPVLLALLDIRSIPLAATIS
jgi:AraC family transcriptional regulator